MVTRVNPGEGKTVAAVQRGERDQFIFICHRDGDIVVRTIGAIRRGDGDVIDIIPVIIARHLEIGRRSKTDLAVLASIVNRPASVPDRL